MSHNTAMFATVGIIVTIAVMAGAVFASTYSNHFITINNTDNLTTTSIITTQSTINPDPTTVTSILTNISLSFHLSLNATSVTATKGVEANASVFNTLQVLNNVSFASNWALPALAAYPGCPYAPPSDHPPISTAVFQGYYTTANISSATALPLLPPGASSGCPELESTYFAFNPSSDTGIVTRSLPPTQMKFQLSNTVILNGYYSTTLTHLYGPNNTVVPAFLPFTPGMYTIVGGDEWGALALAYFQVV